MKNRQEHTRVRHASAAALLALVLVAAGCAGGSDETSGPPPAERTPEATVPPEPPAASPAQYRAELARAGGRVRNALAGVRRAPTQQRLAARLRRAGTLLERAAADLDEVIAPPAAAAVHPRVVGALAGLARTATAAREAVESDQVCGAPSAIARLARSRHADRLRAQARKLRGLGFAARGLAPPTADTPRRRLANGAVLDSVGGGSGVLTVDNGTGKDGVVKLVDRARRTVLALYVRRGSEATAGGIPPGTMRIYFATGDDWDAKRNTFTRRCAFERFDGTAEFTSAVGQYTALSITLHAVVGGNASTRGIGAGAFPR